MLQASGAHDARTSGRRRSFTPVPVPGLPIWNASAISRLGAGRAPGNEAAVRWFSHGGEIRPDVPSLILRRCGRRLGRVPAGQTLVLAPARAFERLHHDWGPSRPWLTLGNVFAEHPGCIQCSGMNRGVPWWVVIWATALRRRASSLPDQ